MYLMLPVMECYGVHVSFAFISYYTLRGVAWKQEMARRVMELEEEAAEVREMERKKQQQQLQQHHHQQQQQPHLSQSTARLSSSSSCSDNDDIMRDVFLTQPGGLYGHDYLTRQNIPGRGGRGVAAVRTAGRESLSVRGRSEERALRAKNEMLERQLAHMKEAAAETQLELAAARKVCCVVLSWSFCFGAVDLVGVLAILLGIEIMILFVDRCGKVVFRVGVVKRCCSRCCCDLAVVCCV